MGGKKPESQLRDLATAFFYLWNKSSAGEKAKMIEPIEGGYRVTVGSVEHPMLPEHYIQWIELLTPTDVLRHELKPGEKPEAIFLTNAEAKDVTAREYCNLHGLWKGVI